MKPFKTKFQRVEIKYILTEAQYQLLIQRLKAHMELNEYAHSTIANLYLDTDDFQMIRHSIEKPMYKEKIRIRSYEQVPSADSQVFVEVKKKFQKVVYKRRITSSLEQSMDFFAGDEVAIEASQVRNELKYMQGQYDEIKPKMYIYYDRDAWQAKDDESVRITFDTNLIYREYDLDLQKGVYGNELLPQGYRLMEVKISGAYPLWLTNILAELGAFKSSFSKYGAAYKKLKSEGGLYYDQRAI